MESLIESNPVQPNRVSLPKILQRQTNFFAITFLYTSQYTIPFVTNLTKGLSLQHLGESGSIRLDSVSVFVD
jgi:hypothetical protein